MADLNPVLSPVASSSAKPAWQSKTLWASALVAVVPLVFPPAGAFVAANPKVVTAFLGVVFGLLRVATKGKVTIA